jgi:FtsZ-interacting cell division protein YlmF
MPQEPTQPPEHKGASSSARAPRKEVDLFPPLADHKPSPASEVPAGGGKRLGMEISMFQPASFEEAIDIVSRLRSRAATTISLDKMRRGDAGRLVDFVSGASAAIDGGFHKLTDMVYVFCPANMKIVAPVRVTPSLKLGGGPLDFIFADAGERTGLRAGN